MNRVGVLTTSFPRWRGDFAGAFVEDAVRALAATGVAVDVLAAGDDETAGGESSGHLIDGVRVHRISSGRPRRGTPRLFYGPGAPEALEQGGLRVWLQAVEFWAGLCGAIRDFAPRWTRIEAHWLVPCGLAARAAAPALPLSIHCHSGDVALLERLRGGRGLARYLAVGPGAVASRVGGPDIRFASRDLKNRFAQLVGAELGSVVSSAERARPPTDSGIADAAPRSEAPVKGHVRRSLGLPDARRTLLSVGRLVPIKGYDVLVRAVAASSVPPRPTLVIVGDGPERSRLAALAQRLEVDLRLPGFVRRDEVATWMAGADLYVQPSRRLPTGRTEGLPVATLEALAAGLPVVASATGGLAELPFGPPRLRLVPPGDARALAACLEL